MNMKKYVFLASLAVAMLTAGIAYASGPFSAAAERWYINNCPDVFPKSTTGINAAVCDLRDRVIALERTEPLQGPQGDPGPPGPQGPPGGSGNSRHVYDGNNQDLGELITLSDGDNHIVTFLPGIGYLAMNPAQPNNQILTSYSISGIYYTEYNCQGQAFTQEVEPLLPQSLIRVGSSLGYVTEQPNTTADRSSKSVRGWGNSNCTVAEHPYTNTHLLNIVTLPFNEPSPWPLEIR